MIQPLLTSMTVLSLVLSGCAVGPDFAQPEPATPQAYTQPTPSVEIDVKHWTELFADVQLTQLVSQARAHNHSLNALYQRTRQSRALIRQEQAGRRPQVDTDSTYARYKDSEALGNTGDAEDAYNASLTLGWELDLFGRVARLVEAAEADAAASEAAYQDLLLITETDVAINYFRLRAIEREVQSVQRSVETRRESLEIVKKRYENGAVSDLDVAQSETLLAQSEADLASLLRSRDTRKNALAVLMGQAAPDFSIQVTALTGKPVDAPAGLPSELLQRRPDIRLAEQNLRAANARIGVAKGNFFPRITLGASGGFAASAASDWFKAGSELYSFGPNINLPLFQGGRLRADLSRSEYAYAEAAANYEQTVVEAFAEVEDALSGWRHLSVQRAALERAAHASARAQTISDNQYRNGIVDFISSLDSERTALEAERSLAQIIGDEYENSIRLIRAIGGNWN
ncbi:efflux transporter outer membrane subunit [Coraliomargarita sp. SDUM461003]|uniref:Efflux transporter outer membrane subunit n=1 Tax=Thalassobacterium maritimum TaxID=3041265 RepID=A0ABU1AVZ8_9BACT|nr:efflux transporter outer membrane subunit [Coraliomargarita sp. SDUM461003]MDQ8207444.1 efflux transporter outer membrane subunit [Coraliomargarita sp. SDUM461003]